LKKIKYAPSIQIELRLAGCSKTQRLKIVTLSLATHRRRFVILAGTKTQFQSVTDGQTE